MSDEPIVKMEITNDNFGLLENLDMVIREALEAKLGQVGAQIETTAVEHIENQDLPWTPLNERYTKWKKKKGYSSKIYIMTSTYQQAITHKVDAPNLAVHIGVMKEAPPHPDTGEDMGVIAATLEYGSADGRIPPRPLWRPTMEQSKRSVQTLFGIAIKKALQRLEAQMGPMPKKADEGETV